MTRIRAYLFLVILLAIAVHFVWVTIAALLPYTIGALVLVGVLGSLYYRKRW